MGQCPITKRVLSVLRAVSEQALRAQTRSVIYSITGVGIFTANSKGFISPQGNVVCEKHRNSTPTQFCVHCGKGIAPGSDVLTALGNDYHPNCFVCNSCNAALTPATAFELSGKIACRTCASAAAMPRGRTAKKPTTTNNGNTQTSVSYVPTRTGALREVTEERTKEADGSETVSRTWGAKIWSGDANAPIIVKGDQANAPPPPPKSAQPAKQNAQPAPPPKQAAQPVQREIRNSFTGDSNDESERRNEEARLLRTIKKTPAPAPAAKPAPAPAPQEKPAYRLTTALQDLEQMDPDEWISKFAQ